MHGTHDCIQAAHVDPRELANHPREERSAEDLAPPRLVRGADEDVGRPTFRRDAAHSGDEIVPFLARGPFRARWRHLPVRASGQAAVACYMWDAERGVYLFHAIDVLTLRDGRIAEITAFLDDGLFADFGLPDELPA